MATYETTEGTVEIYWEVEPEFNEPDMRYYEFDEIATKRNEFFAGKVYHGKFASHYSLRMIMSLLETWEADGYWTYVNLMEVT